MNADNDLIASKRTEILLTVYEQEVVQGKPLAKLVAEEFSLTDSQLRDVLTDLQVSGHINRSGQDYASLTESGRVLVEKML